jgi:hypothetical protein
MAPTARAALAQPSSLVSDNATEADMAREWPTDPDDPVDPALAPLIEAGEGEAEGFDVAESDLVAHSRHDDEHSTEPIMRDAAGFDEPELVDDEIYGEADEEVKDDD